MKSNDLHVVNKSTSPTLESGVPPTWWRAWWPALVIAAVVFAASSMPGRALPHAVLFQGQDKAQHALVYGLLGFFVARARWTRQSLPDRMPWRTVVFAAMAALGFGITDEFHQSFVPGRAVEVLDAVADLVGGLLGGTVFVARAGRVSGRARWPALRRDAEP